MLKTCTACGSVLEASADNFYQLRKNGQFVRFHGKCKKCHNEDVKRWQKAHPEHYESYQKGWVKAHKAANPEIWKARQHQQDVRKMGKTVEWYAQKLEEQGGVCAICRRPETEKHHRSKQVQRLCVDHDHRCCPGSEKSCGRCVRGLLCTKCNRVISLIEAVPNWAEHAIAYLEKYAMGESVSV